MRKVIAAALWVAAVAAVVGGAGSPAAAQKGKKAAAAEAAAGTAVAATPEEVAKHLKLAEPTNISITRIRAVEYFVHATPKDAGMKAEVAKVLIVYAEDNDSTVRGLACNALRTWATTEQAEKLMVLMNTGKPAQAKGAVVALGNIQHEPAIPSLIRFVDTGEHKDLPVKALVAMGPKAEKAVIALLTKPGAKANAVKECCNILLQIGTPASLPALKDAAKSKDRNVSNPAQAAVEAVEGRAKSGK
jgi:HEAT repeat protein